jgi:hypothetical protein
MGAYLFRSADNNVDEILGGPFPRSTKYVDIGSVSPAAGLWDINGSFCGKYSVYTLASAPSGPLPVSYTDKF